MPRFYGAPGSPRLRRFSGAGPGPLGVPRPGRLGIPRARAPLHPGRPQHPQRPPRHLSADRE
ncbi:hypothetical protein GCM10010353_55460 [Streptomyces chryseus]|nr:hypothetical protein GCM10010353_55460 [Streptomyces chryseus]